MVIRSRNGRAPGKMCFFLSSCLWGVWRKPPMVRCWWSMYEVWEGWKAALSKLFCTAQHFSPTTVNMNIYIPYAFVYIPTFIYIYIYRHHARHPQGKKKIKWAEAGPWSFWSLQLHAVGPCLSSGRESASSWQRWPGMSPGWFLWVVKGDTLMNSHQQLGWL